MASTSQKIQKLIRFNRIMALLHLMQGVAVLVLSRNFTLPIQANFLSFDLRLQQLVPATRTLYDLPLAWLITAFLFMSSAAHLIISTVYKKRYEKGLKQGINRARWIEYAFSASTMMVAIAMLVGIYDIGLLLAIFALSAVMNLLGLVMEIHNQTTQKTNWVSYLVGCFAGIVPWIVIAIYFWSAASFGDGKIPNFVYWIYVSIFIFFNCFAINMFLQYKKWGKWSDYLYGERVYIILSLVAKSLLAWQVFAGTLRP